MPSSILPKTARVEVLDSLRGLAALTVVFGHFRNLWDGHAQPKVVQIFLLLPLRLISSGHAAVLFFFLLSGFVLSIPIIRDGTQVYHIYLIRRICRIYIPYLFALAFAVLGAYYLHDNLPLSPWFQRTWSQAPNWNLVGQHVLFLGEYKCDQFNAAFWSLIVEMRISIIFPLLCWIVLRIRPIYSVATTLLLSITWNWISLHQPTKALQALATLHFLLFFVIGILLSQYSSTIAKYYLRLSQRTKIMAILSSVVLYAFGPVLGGATFTTFDAPITDWISGLGAAGIIVFALNSAGMHKTLLHPICKILGKLSYSMYLMHATVLFTLIHLLYGRCNYVVIFAAYMICVAIITWLFYLAVEKPSIRIGRYLGQVLKKSKDEERTIAVV
jgi:peptidoglycan/LPS O-acetylase OafA/YrhL